MEIERRDFLKGTAAVALGLALAPSRVLGANDRIVAGFIGTGRQGRDDMKAFLKQDNVEVAAVCDVYDVNLEKGAKIAGEKAARLTDFRRLLDNRDINVVGIASPDHWHPLMAIMAAQAGKDVYVQKPISVTVEEGRAMVKAARRYERVMQVGTQQRSGLHFQKAVEIVQSGRLGHVSFVRSWNYGNSFPEGSGHPPDSDPPAGLDWDMWLGPAPSRPFNSNRFGVGDRWSTFRYFYDYAGGMMTDWGVHLIDIVQWAMKADAPSAVTASGGRFAIQDNTETPDTLQVTYEYPGFVATYENRELNGMPFLPHKSYGITFHGTNGTLFVDREGWEIFPERTVSGRESRNRTEPESARSANDQETSHWTNFLECVKSRKQPISDIEVGHRSTTACHLGNVAYRSRQRVEWDGQAERVTNVSAKHLGRGQMFLSRHYRKPWKLSV